MNTEKYKRQLKAKEQDLLVQLTRAGQRARESSDDTARDPGDESVADEQKDEQFRGSNVDWATLGQVREALKRIDDGTFGACLVDGEPIQEQRLEAIPWTAYSWAINRNWKTLTRRASRPCDQVSIASMRVPIGDHHPTIRARHIHGIESLRAASAENPGPALIE